MVRAKPPLMRGLCILLGLAALAPFVNRAFSADEPYHRLIARWQASRPGAPYDFPADDAGHGNPGWERGRPPRMVNPLLFHQYLGLVMRLWGGELWKLRLSLLVFPLMALAAMGSLGRRLLGGSETFWPGAFLLAAPAFWLGSTALLMDVFMLALELGGLALFIKGTEERHRGWLALGGLLLGLSPLAKYTGGLGLLLAGCWLYLKSGGRGLARSAWVFGLMLAPLALWSWWTWQIYGEPHLLAAWKRSGEVGWAKALAVLFFWSGSTLLPFAFLLKPWVRSRAEALAWAAASAGSAAVFVSPYGGFSPGQAVVAGLCLTSSLAFLWRIARGWGSLWERREDRFLLIWFACAAFALWRVMPWTAARYHLIALPPAILLVLRLVSSAVREPAGRASYLRAVGTAMAAWTFCLALTDYAQAYVNRRIHRDLPGFLDAVSHRPTLSPRFYFLGDAFTDATPYLEDLGGAAAFPDDRLPRGALLVRKTRAMPAQWAGPVRADLEFLGALEYPSRWPLRVMDLPSSAGFYASVWGALPWSFTLGPWERLLVHRVK